VLFILFVLALILWSIFLIVFILLLNGFFVPIQNTLPVGLVVGTSMRPTIGFLSIQVVERDFTLSEIKEGDIIMSYTKGTVLSHRVITIEQAKNSYSFTTHGDNNKTQFENGKDENYKGKVVWWITIIP